MIVPNGINLGDTIGIFAPASSYTNDIMIAKINQFASLGFNIKTPKNLYAKYGYFAGSEIQRAEDFNSLISDNDVKALIAFRGGYGSINILKYIDIKNIIHHPKIICGFSDLTVLLNYITDKSSLITLHGPMVNSNFSDKTTLNSFISSLKNPYEFSYDISNLKTFNEKNISGVLSGGNLSIICSSLSTPYECNFENKILLIEDTHEDPYNIDKMLSQLLLSGNLNKCNGFIIGNLSPKGNDYEIEENTFSYEQVISNILVPLKKPIIYGMPFGHENQNITIPLGRQIHIDFNKKFIY